MCAKGAQNRKRRVGQSFAHMSLHGKRRGRAALRGTVSASLQNPYTVCIDWR